MTKTLNFTAFIANGDLMSRNAWIREPGITMYVRRSAYPGIDIDLANLTADRPGKGAFSKFLDRYEHAHTFRIENIMNDRLVPYLERRGYSFHGRLTHPPSMFKNKG